MGNDGGSIPTRRELVKVAARNPNLTDLREKQKEHLAHRWSQCPISHKALVKPIVADYTGDLYNKDAVLQFLLPDEVSPLDKFEAAQFIQNRIKGLKDVVEVHFEVEKDAKMKTEKWLCPVTSKELGPNVKAVFLVPCGHAFSREAIETMKDVTSCPTCGSAYEHRDVIPILPYTETDKAMVLARMETLRALGLTHSLKKASGSKKRKANGDIKGDSKPDKTDTATDKGNTTVTGAENNIRTGTPQSDMSMSKSSSGIRNNAMASLTAKILEEEDAKKKRRLQLGENENLKTLYSKSANGKTRDGDFMTRGFSIPTADKK